jgi:hypothetical protein
VAIEVPRRAVTERGGAELPKYMLLFVGMAARPDATDATTEDYNQRWMQWIGGLAQRGALESGAPFEPTGKRVEADSTADLELDTVDIGGYMLIEAADLDEAAALAREAPHMALGGSTIVRPCVAVGPPQ